LQSEHVVNVVTLGLPAGAIITVDPNVNAFDGVDEGTCAQARLARRGNTHEKSTDLAN